MLPKKLTVKNTGKSELCQAAANRNRASTVPLFPSVYSIWQNLWNQLGYTWQKGFAPSKETRLQMWKTKYHVFVYIILARHCCMDIIESFWEKFWRSESDIRRIAFTISANLMCQYRHLGSCYAKWLCCLCIVNDFLILCGKIIIVSVTSHRKLFNNFATEIDRHKSTTDLEVIRWREMGNNNWYYSFQGEWDCQSDTSGATKAGSVVLVYQFIK